MIVMPANNSGWHVGYLHGRYGGLGWLWTATVDGGRVPNQLWPYAIDNGIYAAWAGRRRWEYRAFLAGAARLIQQGRQRHHLPLFLAVPDAVADRRRTLRRWHAWAPRLAALRVPLAFVVQDGMTWADVPPTADWIFVGGSDHWKERTLHTWCAGVLPVHVGRVNGYRMLRAAADAGAASCDGSGWFRGDQRQLAGLERFLAEQAGVCSVPAQLPFVEALC